MAKTPTCPYCGGGMELVEEYGWVWRAHYSCPICYATSPVGKDFDRQNAIDRAGELALHRADILHAQWIPYGNDDECAECGNCGYLHQKYDLDGMETAHSYCPECGAKMEPPDTPKEGDE